MLLGCFKAWNGLLTCCATDLVLGLPDVFELWAICMLHLNIERIHLSQEAWRLVSERQLSTKLRKLTDSPTIQATLNLANGIRLHLPVTQRSDGTAGPKYADLRLSLCARKYIGVALGQSLVRVTWTFQKRTEKHKLCKLSCVWESHLFVLGISSLLHSWYEYIPKKAIRTLDLGTPGCTSFIPVPIDILFTPVSIFLSIYASFCPSLCHINIHKSWSASYVSGITTCFGSKFAANFVHYNCLLQGWAFGVHTWYPSK